MRINDDLFTISAKNLGSVALPGFCQRCFWLRRHCRKLPFQIFPGIFQSIDAYTKCMTDMRHKLSGNLPQVMLDAGLTGSPAKIPSRAKLRTPLDGLGVELSGEPDELIRMDDATYAVLDYKTAKFTENQDALLPMYEVQLNAYAVMLESCGMSPVTRLALIYYEPQAAASEDAECLLTEEGFLMAFKGKLKEVGLDRAKVFSLAEKAREIWAMETIPASKEGCPDCIAIDDLCGHLSSNKHADNV